MKKAVGVQLTKEQLMMVWGLLMAAAGFWVRLEVRFNKVETKSDVLQESFKQVHDFEKAIADADKAEVHRRLDALESKRRR